MEWLLDCAEQGYLGATLIIHCVLLQPHIFTMLESKEQQVMEHTGQGKVRRNCWLKLELLVSSQPSVTQPACI